ncbi:hypothetical protein Hs30E_06360 [Lactococcus hodotermopsidis]|uniref:Uncharacterized protein n=1 Tax=Pseudolactococcus hodotermopsidis TaxID=2709157 RepID=A0A6A0BBQ0_9LACT|nr:hypothetical protein [Lactococcus hodotermopsidis]GFH42085.1 hypothetical protein Hs30E_06360 [Lactococcus hodotermopsidis]
MFIKYLYILLTRLRNTSKGKIGLNLIFFLIIQFCFYLGLKLLINNYPKLLIPILIFVGIIIGAISFMFMDKKEIVFLSRVVSRFDYIKFRLFLILNIYLIAILDIVVSLYLLKTSIVKVFFLLIGIAIYFVMSKILLSFDISKIIIQKIPDFLSVDTEKEIKLFLKGSYFQLFILIYMIVLCISVTMIDTTIVAIFISFIYNDIFTLNCIGIEQQELMFLKKEGILTFSYLKRKFNFWFVVGFALYLLLIMEKMLLLGQINILLVINLISVYILNFLVVMSLAINKAEYKLGYYKVKITSLYLELVFCLLYLSLFYIFGEIIVLVNVCLIFYFYKKVKKIIDKEFNFESSN